MRLYELNDLHELITATSEFIKKGFPSLKAHEIKGDALYG